MRTFVTRFKQFASTNTYKQICLVLLIITMFVAFIYVQMAGDKYCDHKYAYSNGHGTGIIYTYCHNSDGTVSNQFTPHNDCFDDYGTITQMF